VRVIIIKVLGYARTSTEGQGLGLEKQKERIRDYCDDNGYELEEILTNQVSGRKKIFSCGNSDLSERPQLFEINQRCIGGDKPEFDKIIILNPSRLARITHYQGMLEELFDDYGAEVEYVESSDKWIVRKILSLIDEYEVRQTIKRTTQALAQREKNDKWNGRPPTGFNITDDGKLEPDFPLYKALRDAEEHYKKSDDGYKTTADFVSGNYQLKGKSGGWVDIDLDAHQVRSFINRDKERIQRCRKE